MRTVTSPSHHLSHPSGRLAPSAQFIAAQSLPNGFLVLASDFSLFLKASALSICHRESPRSKKDDRSVAAVFLGHEISGGTVTAPAHGLYDNVSLPSRLPPALPECPAEMGAESLGLLKPPVPSGSCIALGQEKGSLHNSAWESALLPTKSPNPVPSPPRSSSNLGFYSHIFFLRQDLIVLPRMKCSGMILAH
uniref:Uncharacterized protein n=1 Tax=Aotus nancymaae TaxID=37293 RepID=A0A2K5EVP8_AOTNA